MYTGASIVSQGGNGINGVSTTSTVAGGIIIGTGSSGSSSSLSGSSTISSYSNSGGTTTINYCVNSSGTVSTTSSATIHFTECNTIVVGIGEFDTYDNKIIHRLSFRVLCSLLQRFLSDCHYCLC
jgi:hypothetical protein